MPHEVQNDDLLQDDRSDTSHAEGRQGQDDSLPSQRETSNAADASLQARQRRRIAQLEEKLGSLEAGRAAKQRQTNYYIAQGRAVRRVVALFDNIEDLVVENDRRCDADEDAETTIEYVLRTGQDRLQVGYVIFTQNLRWFHKEATDMENHDYVQMLKMLRQGAESARGDDTSKLKGLVSEWVNREFKPDPPVDADDKNLRGFANDACGRLLCPAELDWNNPAVKSGIRNRSDGHIVTDLSFPAFLYERYTADPNDLEEGLFKGKILLQGYKAVFTSPSSAKDTEGDGDGADVIQNNRHARRSSSGLKVKKHIRFALSSVTSWRSFDGDFDYVQFWRTIVDFFERPPGRDARRRVDRLLEWWTRKVFGRRCRQELSDAAKANMSVNSLARQRAMRDDAAFDSP
ncbi:hypothetical protein DEU56DRAFT_748001 [Suillus clintonianus]|uniref:uncharacterized protein n=1 Tax=Suillus clintonianus TaxID=1904413 RepID=UPI001B86144B|nr:uncharacterized protein DEU56DRAFT_748001 [Suillus clintonianus]KAG2117611.1 hypothetical protein DEU56DRAFT_748001 [Suillus clintonianus]